MEELLTIKESALFTGKSESVLYKLIRKNKLTVQNHIVTIQGTDRTVKKLSKSELERVFNLTRLSGSEPPDYQVQNHTEPKENLRDVLEQFFTEKQSAIMKPMEQQALFIAGTLTKENEFLKQQVETLRIENDQLRENMKALPVEDTTPIKEENQRLKEQLAILPAEVDKVNEMLKLSSEKLIQVEDENQKISKILMQNADNINVLQKQREDLNKKLQQETERRKKEAEETLKLRDELAKAEADKIEIANTWKKELEEARRPWWRFW